MKKIVCLILSVMLGSSLFASGQMEELHYIAGSLNILETPFAIRNCRIGDPSIVSAEVMNSNRLRISSLKIGTTDIQIMGDTAVKLYRIYVDSNLQETLRNLTTDLDSIPEVEAVISGNKITLKGEVSNIVHWEMLQKLLPFYRGNIVNLVTFQPKAEVMLLLQKSLSKAGYTIVKEGTELKHGDLVVIPVGDTLNVSGTVYSPEDLKRIEDILN